MNIISHFNKILEESFNNDSVKLFGEDTKKERPML